MKLHTSWLQKYLDRSISPRELVDAMPRAGLEVEAEEAAGDGFQIELKVLPNRPDCLGILGVAREMAALFDTKVVWPAVVDPTPSGDESIPVEIADSENCRRFTAAAFRGVKVAPSPAWLQDALKQAGLRPINNVVDITNFVMWETGQPLHAFDLGKLAGPKIVVRKLRAGESLELLSGKTITEKYGKPLVVCDAEKPQALAGIMGGKSAETANATTDVLLEVAYFDPVHVRNNVKTLRKIDGTGGTDASYRFERGVDPNGMLDFARRRAYALITELAGGKLAGPATDVVAAVTPPKIIKLSAERVSRLIGTAVDAAKVKQSLTKLGYGVADDLTVTVPTFRVDVNDPVVLAEDVARMIGYDNIAAESRPARATRGQDCLAARLRTAFNRALVNAGWLETKNDPLESETKSATWLGARPRRSFCKTPPRRK
ncbi:MAG: phenylalanine--tRNA ligase subunit beta [Tepidisphaeraceae bacterium]